MNEETPFDVIFNRLCRHLSDTQRIDVISKDFMRLSDDFQRMQFLLDLESVRDIVQITPELILKAADSKSICKSVELRNEGNRLFREKKYDEAIFKYTQSLSHAPVNQNEFHNIERNAGQSFMPLTSDVNNCNVSTLSSTSEHCAGFSNEIKSIETKIASMSVDDCAALAYANRSAILFHLNQYSSCLDDIRAALVHEYPSKMRYKLEERRARCHLGLKEANMALKFFEAASACLQFSDLDEKKRIQFQNELDKNIATCKNIALSQTKSNAQNISTAVSSGSDADCESKERNIHSDLLNNMPQFTDSPNVTYPSLSSAANVAYTNDRGRFIVAARDIVPGDVILIERPYASVLLPGRYNDHCRRCYRQTLTLVPCNYCASALYCCVDCRSSDLHAHSRECRGGVLEIFHLSGMDKFAFLAVRSIAMMSLESLMQLRSSLNAKKQVEGEISSPGIAGEVYESDDYSTICRLVTNDKMRSAHDLFRRGIIAVYLLRGLQHVGYFQSNHKLSTPDISSMVGFVGGLLLSHLQSFPCNAHEISEFVLDPAAIATSEPRELGAGIYATLSLFNHSCDPAVTRNFFGDTCVVRAIRSVRAGDELSDNYGAVFAIQTREERQKKLAPQYYFQCGCDACLGDWPLFDVSQSLAPIWRCSGCQTSPLSTSGDCKGCGAHESVAEQTEILKLSHVNYTKAFQLLLAGDAKAALPTLLVHLRVIDELCCRPWAEYSSCQEAVKQCFSILSNCCLASSSSQSK